jgi:hypothetical protein
VCACCRGTVFWLGLLVYRRFLNLNGAACQHVRVCSFGQADFKSRAGTLTPVEEFLAGVYRWLVSGNRDGAYGAGAGRCLGTPALCPHGTMSQCVRGCVWRGRAA